MTALTRRLPNLSQLRAFEAAARHLSFKRAAEELHVTQAAISHQIKALEADLGRQLFRRVTRGVQLLPEAAELSAELTRHLSEVAEATARFSRPCGLLRISSVPAYGNRIILPRIAEFRAAHPEIELSLTLQSVMVDFRVDPVDAAVRYGFGDWPGLSHDLVNQDVVTPLCAPSLVGTKRLPLSAAEICALPVAISPDLAGDWDRWFAAAGHTLARPLEMLVMENRAVLIDFLLVGSGVALMDLRFAARDLEAGRLIRLHPVTVRGGKGVHLVYPTTHYRDPRVEAFGQWLKSVIDRMPVPASDPA